MKAINWTAFKEHGCVKCGCATCYSTGIVGSTSVVKCQECEEKFLILSDDLSMSNVGFPVENYDGIVFDEERNVFFHGEVLYDCQTGIMKQDLLKKYLQENNHEVGTLIDGFVYPCVINHPREKISSHEYEGIATKTKDDKGYFCVPVNLDRDLVCDVKSKEDGQKITKMINDIGDKFGDFRCQLNYDKCDDNFSQIIIKFQDDLRAALLAKLIQDNSNVITKDIVMQSLTQDIDFETFWKCKILWAIDKSADIRCMHDFVLAFGGFPKEMQEDSYYAFQRENYVDQFEVLGACKQINLEFEKKNFSNAWALMSHLVDLNNDSFNKKLKASAPGGTEYFEYCRQILQNELSNVVKVYSKYKNEEIYSSSLSNTIPLKKNFKLSSDMKANFILDWQSVMPTILEVIDFPTLKIATTRRFKTDEQIIQDEKEAFESLANPYAMFSLFGLCVQVTKCIEDNQIETAILAIEHVSKQIDSPLFVKLYENKDSNDVQVLKTKAVYARLVQLTEKYYHQLLVSDEAKRALKQ